MTQRSVQRAKEVAVPATFNASNTNGRRRTAFNNGTIVTAGGLAVGVIIELFTLPAGARLLGGVWGNDATFSGAGVTLDIGWAADTNALASALDCASLNHTAINNTLALNYGTLLSADTLIYVTTAVDVIVDAGTYYCAIDFMI